MRPMNRRERSAADTLLVFKCSGVTCVRIGPTAAGTRHCPLPVSRCRLSLSVLLDRFPKRGERPVAVIPVYPSLRTGVWITLI